MKEKNFQQSLKNNYKSNFTALKKRYPKLADKTAAINETGKYRVYPNIDNKTFNLYLNDLDKFYYDQNNPLYDVKLNIDALKLKNTKIALFLGFGLGYEAIYYMQYLAQEQKTGAIIIVEESIEIFTMALYTTNIVPLLSNKNIHFIVGEKKENLFTEYEKIISNSKNMTYVKAVNPVYYPTAFLLSKKYYMNALKSFKEAAVHVINFAGNSPDDSLLGLKNMFDNIDIIIESPGINLLFDKFRNKPAVVVASGPSLKKNMHLLEDIKDKSLIVCAESTFRILMNKGIKPHLVASLERTDRTQFSFDGFAQEDVKNIYLAGCPVIPKKVYDIYPGPNLIVYRKFAHFTWLEMDKGMLDIKQSSANMAFKIAIALGCDPIILIGQDLAFDKETKATHADYHIKGSNQDRYNKERIFEVKSNDGGTILTTDSWFKFLKSYEIDVAEYKGTCINATEGGAFIEGTKVMDFKDAIDKYMKEDIFPLDVINNSIKDYIGSDKSKDKERIVKKINDSINDIEKMIDYCHEGSGFVEEKEQELRDYLAMENLDEEFKNHIIDLYREVIKYKNKLQSFSDTFQLLIMHIVQPIYIKFEIDMNEIPSKYEIYEKGVVEIILRQRDWFATINNLCIIVQEELRKAKENLIKNSNQ